MSSEQLLNPTILEKVFQFVTRLREWMPQILMIEFALLAILMMIGIGLMLRRWLKKPQLEGGNVYDMKQISGELIDIIQIMVELRRRVDPEATFNLLGAGMGHGGGDPKALLAKDREIDQLRTSLSQLQTNHEAMLEQMKSENPNMTSFSGNLDSELGEKLSASQKELSARTSELEAHKKAQADLEKENTKLKAEIVELKAKLEKGGASGDASNEKVVVLEEKIKSLNSQLAEYEVIVEDIADVKTLRRRIAELETELMAANDARGGEAKPAAAAPAAAAVAPPAPVAAAPTPPPAAPAAPAPAAAAPAGALSQNSIDDLFGSSAPAAAAPAADPKKLLDQTQTLSSQEELDKMLADLEGGAPAAPAATAPAAPSAPAAEVDIGALAEEFGSFLDNPPEKSKAAPAAPTAAAAAAPSEPAAPAAEKKPDDTPAMDPSDIANEFAKFIDSN